MKKENGFTLIELLAVIAILAIIAIIVYPVIIGTLTKSKDDAKGVQEETLERAAKQFTTEKAAELGDNVCVKISTLQSLGYLESGKIVDPKDDSKTYNNRYYNITWDNSTNQYKYSLDSRCITGNEEYK